MTLIKWNNGNKVNLSDRNYFPSLISDFFGTLPFEDLDFTPNRGRLPSVNISEDTNHYKIELAVPGMKKSDFKIEVENGVLTISSEIKSESEEKKEKYTRKEFMYSSFNRSFSLPESVNPEQIDALYIDGILSLNLPKKDEAKMKVAREIKIS